MSLNRTGKPLKRKPIKRHKTQTTLDWDEWIAAYLEECRGDDGLIPCGECGERLERPDPHHKLSKTSFPQLRMAKSNIVWLCRKHHEAIHNDPNNRADGWRPEPLSSR